MNDGLPEKWPSGRRTLLEPLTPWALAEKLLREHLKRHGGRLVALYRVGTHGGRLSFCLNDGSYSIVEAHVPRNVSSRTAIDGALAFALLWQADFRMSDVGRLHHSEGDPNEVDL